MPLQGDRDPVRRRPGQAGGGDELGEGGGAGFEGVQHGNGLVQDADSARVVHGPILPSRIARRNSRDRGLPQAGHAAPARGGPPPGTVAQVNRRQAQGGTPMGRTLAQKIWDSHVVRSAAGEPDLLYIDLHLVHEVTSPQAFDGLRLAGRTVRRPDLTVATEDHNVPTAGVTGPDLPLRGPGSPVTDPVSQVQVEALRKNCAEFGIRLHPMGDAGPGDRPRDRPAAGPDAARHDDRLRRLAHQHARRVRRAGVRHRHQRGRARAGHPDAAPGAARRHGGHRDRRACPSV